MPKDALAGAGRLLARAAGRFRSDDPLTRAAALTYTTLLSLVPFLAVFFAVLSAFGTFLGTESRLEAFLLRHLLPGSASAAIGHLTRFTEKTAAVGAIGFVALLLTALLLLDAIETAFRRIYRLPEGRSIRQRLLSYWTMLTVAPVLLGLSIYVSGSASRLSPMLKVAGVERAVHAWALVWQFLLPLAISWGAFTVAYLVLPATGVRPRAAAGGALVAAVLFEAAKAGFDWYVRSFASFEKLYGAVALVPIFLVWVNLTWLIVLFGAEVAYCSQHPEVTPADERRARPRASPGPLAARVLWVVARDFAAGRRRPTAEAVADELGADADAVAAAVAALEAEGLVARVLDPADGDGSPGLLPARPLAGVTVADAVRAGERAGGGRAEGSEADSPVLGLLVAAEAEASTRLEGESYAGLVARWHEASAEPAGSAPPYRAGAPHDRSAEASLRRAGVPTGSPEGRP
jgi:membrane protein